MGGWEKLLIQSYFSVSVQRRLGGSKEQKRDMYIVEMGPCLEKQKWCQHTRFGSGSGFFGDRDLTRVRFCVRCSSLVLTQQIFIISITHT